MADLTDFVDSIMTFEDGELEDFEVVELFQKMINDGSVWSLQGSYGRQAMTFIEEGICTLGEHGCRDYYGNYIPSKTEVEPGTKGSVEYCERKRAEREGM